MKKAIYGTIALFLTILIVVAVISLRNPPHEVKYENGRVVPMDR
jgi:hypothetical protein